jgi:hypothetical protein
MEGAGSSPRFALFAFLGKAVLSLVDRILDGIRPVFGFNLREGRGCQQKQMR